MSIQWQISHRRRLGEYYWGYWWFFRNQYKCITQDIIISSECQDNPHLTSYKCFKSISFGVIVSESDLDYQATISDCHINVYGAWTGFNIRLGFSFPQQTTYVCRNKTVVYVFNCNPSKKPSLVLLLPFPSPPPPPSRFLHRLQTSITWSIIKLECFLRPFLTTRSHDESAHTFKSSLWFLEVPQKGV